MADRESPRPSLEDAIDRAVRQVMDVDARPGFERRVRHRLAHPRVATSPAVFRFATAAVVLATIVVSVLLLRDTPERTVPMTHAEQMASANTPPPAPQPHVPTATRQKPSTVATAIRDRRAPRSTRERTVLAAGRAEAAADDARAITTVAALEAPAALAVGTIEQPPVTIANIRLAQLEIRGLHVAPLPATDDSGKE